MSEPERRVAARDLPFIDAVAVVAALVLAYAARAATNATYPLAWDGVVPYVRAALAPSLAVVLLSVAALGLYGPRAATASAREHLAAAAYATAGVAVVATVWGGAFPPTLILVPGFAFLLAGLHLGRRAYFRPGTPS